MMSYYLGFDGGGSKTECAVIDGENKIFAQSLAGPSNPLRVGRRKAFAALQAAANEALKSARVKARQIEGVCAGLAGAGRPSVAQGVAALLGKAFPRSFVHVTSDLEVALEAAVGSGAGVVLVAGTGSAAYGRNADGQTARAGGWGPWIGDEGSAFDIGRLALATAALARDRGKRLELEVKILAAVNCPDWETLIERITKKSDEVFPKVFPLVVKAADAGSGTAREILSSAAKALAGLAGDVIRSLGLGREEFSLAKVGGVFGQSAYLDSTVHEWLTRIAPRARIESLRVSPAVGAARLARRLHEASHGGKG